MKILGVDCGSERTGYGVISSDGRRHELIVAGVIRTASSTSLAMRLGSIGTALREVVRTHEPAVMAVEDVFHAMNARSALRLAHVRGVALLVAAEAGLDVGEYSALEVKMSVVGFGRAEKRQVELMVRSILATETPLETYDASDALAVALCHAMRTPAIRTKGRRVAEAR
jgi:crossover junction endodeoxyribonuclease RuvC